MSKEIHKLLKIGETENVEFKETDNEAFYKTLSAFSNGEGGNLVLGVNDRGEVTIEDLKKPSHGSILRNKLIARVFYLAGYIEQWGTGTHRMIEDLKSAGLPEPQFESHFGFRVWFYKDIYTEEKLRNSVLAKGK